jgi:hypothetical protein
MCAVRRCQEVPDELLSEAGLTTPAPTSTPWLTPDQDERSTDDTAGKRRTPEASQQKP